MTQHTQDELLDLAPFAEAGSTLEPGLVLHRSPRADLMVDALAELLSAPARTSDPFATEVVSVPTTGVERWLAQSLAERLGGTAGEGVCAGVAFPTLGRLLEGAVTAVLPEADRVDPWHRRRLVWPVLTTFEAVAGEDWFAPVAAHLEEGGDVPDERGSGGAEQGSEVGRRWTTARRLASLFARYADERPEMLRAWSVGQDVGSLLTPIEDDLGWQPRLWRALASRIEAPTPPARLDAAVVALERSPELVPLPERLSVFGPSRINRRQLRLLTALARHRETHLWLPHTSPGEWARIAAELKTGSVVLGADLARGRASPRPGHRLNDRLGRDQRELQLLLSAAATRDLEHPAPTLPSTLLGRLQSQVLHDRPPVPVAQRHGWEPSDTSIQVHTSHGPNRQVEVLRDVLLGLLADDPSLEPRDIVVMVPDIETFAPLIQAGFGLEVGHEAADSHPAHRLRVRLADRSLRRVNPLLELLASLLDLTSSRAEAGALIDLATQPAVARRFRIRAEDQLRMAELVQQSGIRWGIDHLHRAQFGMGTFPQNTWSAGLQRMLLGVAMSEDGQPSIGTVLPLDSVDSSEVDLVGGLAELISRVRRAVTSFSRPQPVDQWVAASRQALEQLTAVAGDDQWQLPHALGVLADLAEGVPPESAPLLGLADFRGLLAEELRGRPSRANFRTGSLTVCTLTPMRSVPHRVVCLLGVDDGVFPRRPALDGDDVLGRAPMVGDRDQLSEDRQLLLEAVMAARERLVVVHCGRDPRTNEHRPDAVPLRELLDAVDETATPPPTNGLPVPVSEQIRTRHPLQPFAPGNFTVDAEHPVPLSFDVPALRGARAGIGIRVAAAGLELGRLPAPSPISTVELNELKRFLAHPARAFLRSRFGLAGSGSDDPAHGEEIPIDPDGLRRWAIGSRVLAGALTGQSWDRLRRAEQLRGEVPPGPLGDRLVAGIRDEVDAIMGAARVEIHQLPETVDSQVDLGEVRLGGAVTGVRDGVATSVRFSRLGPKQELESWLDLLLLSAAHPSRDWQARAVGRITRWSPPLELAPVPPSRAREVLTRLIELYRAGLGDPLPLPLRTGQAYARLRASGLSEDEACQHKSLASQLRFDLGDDPEAWATLGLTSLSELTAQPATAAERDTYRTPHRLGAAALTLWQPLLQHRDQR